MKKINKFMTHDGVMHDSIDASRRHLDKLYGDKLTQIAHALVKTDGKYKAVCDYVDANLYKFVELADIAKDTAYEDTEDQ